MDKLRQLLRETETVDIPAGHLSRFEHKLDQAMPSRNNAFFKPSYFSVAASIAVLISVLIIRTIHNAPPSNLIFSQGENDLIETEIYLQYQINQKINEINVIKLNNIEPNILEDIKEMDESLELLKNDYSEAPGDSRIINAVIITYMKKIEVLNNIKIILQKKS